METGIYGEVTLRHELAHGVYQLILAAGNSLRALIIGKEFAKEVLSQAAIDQSDEYDEKTLGYPEEDGRMSIPIHELAQKGLINLPFQEAKEHFNNLLHLVPEYLRSRGILKAKAIPDLQTKLADENHLLERKLTSLSKKSIISQANKIAEMSKIRQLISSEELPIKNQGLLISTPNLLEKMHKAFKNNRLEINADNLQWLCANYEKVIDIDKSAVDESLDDITNELKRTYDTPVKTIVMQYQDGGSMQEFALSINYFEKLITDEMKTEFAKAYMIDFPCEDYYGEENKWIFEGLFMKRFGENLQENWERFSHQGDVQLHLKNLSTEIIVTDSYTQLRNMAMVKSYIQSSYENADKYIEKLISEKDLDTYKKVIDGVSKVIEKLENKKFDIQTEEQSEQDNNQEEKVEKENTENVGKKNIEFVSKPRKKPILPSRKLLNKAQKIDVATAEKLTKDLIADRNSHPDTQRAMYVLNKKQPNEVIRICTNYDPDTQKSNIKIESYDVSQTKFQVTNLSESDLHDYINHLTTPVIMTASVYTEFRNQQMIDNANSFDEEVSPFVYQKSPLLAEQISIICSDISIEAVDITGAEETAKIEPITPPVNLEDPEMIVEEITEEFEM